MGDLRKDYVVDRYVIVSQDERHTSDSKKCPYCPGNESMTNPSALSLVAKDGMLQRLQDSEDYYVKDWSVRVFESKNPVVATTSENSYSDRPLYSEPAYGYHYVDKYTGGGQASFKIIEEEAEIIRKIFADAAKLFTGVPRFTSRLRS